MGYITQSLEIQMTEDMAAMFVSTTEKEMQVTLLLLYTNMAAMTSHANQKYFYWSQKQEQFCDPQLRLKLPQF